MYGEAGVAGVSSLLITEAAGLGMGMGGRWWCGVGFVAVVIFMSVTLDGLGLGVE